MPARSDTSRTDLALLVLRVAVGGIFVAHGAMKVFTFGHSGVSRMFAGMGIPLPGIAAAGVMALELLGGIALVLGLGTRIVAALFVADMIGAIVFAKLKGGFFAPNGYEFELLLGVGALALAIAGAGVYSLDGRRTRR